MAASTTTPTPWAGTDISASPGHVRLPPGPRRKAATQLLEGLSYNEGKRYADFNASTDRVAEYGLAALVGVAVAKKLGLIALIGVFLAKFAQGRAAGGGGRGRAGGAAVPGPGQAFGMKPRDMRTGGMSTPC